VNVGFVTSLSVCPLQAMCHGDLSQLRVPTLLSSHTHENEGDLL